MGTKKPSGLKIKRDGLIFTFSWKKGETYADGQQLQYKLYEAPSQDVADSGRDFLSQGFEISGTKWVSLTVSASADNKSLTLNASNYYPNAKKRLYGVAFRVRGNADRSNKDPGWSAWVSKTIVIKAPKAPDIESSWDSSYSNRSTYEWTAVNEEKRPATDVQYVSVVKQDCPADVKGLAEWGSASPSIKTLTGTNYHDETGLAGVSKTRVVRVRARGIGGYSKWSYAKHVFAAPYAAEIVTHNALYDSSNDIWNLNASWTTPQDAGHPVDFYNLQYRIGKPSSVDLDVTTDNSWTDLAPTTAGDISAQITQELDDDECLWLRVTASHDNHTGNNAIAGQAVRAYTGAPAAPSDLAITASDLSTRTVSLTVDNNSAITDSKVAICFQPSNNPSNYVIVDVLSGSGTITKTGIKCPDWSGTGTLGFMAFAFVGRTSYQTDTTGVKRYTVTSEMISASAFTAGGIPKAPATYSAKRDGNDIYVEWDWTWEDANAAEVSWSKNRKSWESSDEPRAHIVSSTGPAHLYVSGVDMGETYFVKVRLLHEEDGTTTYGPYSGMMQVHMTDAPVAPTLSVSDDVIRPGDSLGLTWTYTSTDGTPQLYAEIAEGVSKTMIASTDISTAISVTPEWAVDTQHDLYVRVVSGSGISSDWSDKVTVTVADPPVCTITQTSLVSAGAGYELQAMPMTITITGAGSTGQTSLKMVRLEAFTQERPDESELTGYAGQLITERIYTGQAQQTIALDDVIEGASIDDTAEYRILASITDGYGQTAEASVDFTVNFSQQPVDPEGIATVTINDTAAYITIAKPTGAANTDKVDIYRLSVDQPELIYQDASFGDVIVDPYPTIGIYGGYRVVLKTKDGDYYTADKVPAWRDLEAGFESESQYIDFDGYQLPLTYNVELQSGFTKQFKKTTYLGGTEEGDYLEGVDRSGSISSVLVTELDVDDIRNLRRLANFSGLAHIRSKEGSSYSANVNVSGESTSYTSAGKVRSVDLSIEACKAPRLDGLTQAEWEA